MLSANTWNSGRFVPISPTCTLPLCKVVTKICPWLQCEQECSPVWIFVEKSMATHNLCEMKVQLGSVPNLALQYVKKKSFLLFRSLGTLQLARSTHRGRVLARVHCLFFSFLQAGNAWTPATLAKLVAWPSSVSLIWISLRRSQGTKRAKRQTPFRHQSVVSIDAR